MKTAERNRRNAISHAFIRLLTATTALNFALFIFVERPAAQSGYGSTIQWVTMHWSMASIAILPSYVLVEWRLMRKSTEENKSLLIDAGFVLSWIILLLATVIYIFGHYAIL